MEDQALNMTQKAYMRKNFFLPYEVAAFANAVTPSGRRQDLAFTSAPFQAMIASRIEYARKLHNAGWSELQIRERILKLYSGKRGKASPWDFLKIEYQPPQGMTDKVWARKLSAKLRIAGKLGSAYGHRMQKQLRPRFEPKIRPLPPMPA